MNRLWVRLSIVISSLVFVAALLPVAAFLIFAPHARPEILDAIPVSYTHLDASQNQYVVTTQYTASATLTHEASEGLSLIHI